MDSTNIVQEFYRLQRLIRDAEDAFVEAERTSTPGTDDIFVVDAHRKLRNLRKKLLLLEYEYGVTAAEVELAVSICRMECPGEDFDTLTSVCVGLAKAYKLRQWYPDSNLAKIKQRWAKVGEVDPMTMWVVTVKFGNAVGHHISEITDVRYGSGDYSE